MALLRRPEPEPDPETAVKVKPSERYADLRFLPGGEPFTMEPWHAVMAARGSSRADLSVPLPVDDPVEDEPGVSSTLEPS